MKGRHMTVVLEVDNGVRNYLFASQAIDSSLLNYHVVIWSEITVEATYLR